MGDSVYYLNKNNNILLESAKYVMAKPIDFDTAINITNKIAIIHLHSGPDLGSSEKIIDLFLKENQNFCVLLDVTSKNFLFLEELIESLTKAKNIILNIPDKDMPSFIDIMPRLTEIIKSTKHPIYTECFPFCILKECKDHVSNIFNKGIKIPKCELCDDKVSCPGIPASYLKLHGYKEITPKNKILDKIKLIRKRFNKNSLIYVSDNDVYRLLQEFSKTKNFWDCINALGYPIAISLELLKLLEQESVISYNKESVKLKIEIKNPKYAIKDFSDHRLKSKPNASQLTVQQQDIEKRINYIIKNCPVGGKIIILGDDDFFSLSLASANHFTEITVLEFDNEICRTITKLANENNYSIKVLNHDLRKKLPIDLIGKFDVFYTDSPYSMPGFSLFISRGVELLKKEPKKQGFASFSCEMPEMEMVEIPSQNIINKMKLLIWKKELGAKNSIPNELKSLTIDEINSKLSNYKELSNDEKWYFGALARKEYLFSFLTTNQTKPIITDNFSEEIYFTDYTLNFYIDENFKKELKKNLVYNWKNDH